MATRGRVRTGATLVALAVIAAACGGRVSDQQVAAEQRADGVAVGASRGVGDGAGSDLFGDATVLDPVTGEVLGSGEGSGQTGGAAGSRPGSSSGAGTSTGVAAPSPPGGNGGATDVGISANEIRVGNVATLTGPVPGLFRGALIGTQAYAAYLNSQGGLYGRRIKVVSGDDAFDTGKNRAAHKGLKDSVFAFVGSFSTFDGAGVGEMESDNVPDVGRELALNRGRSKVHYSPVPVEVGWNTTGASYLKARYGADTVKKAAFVWAAVDAARQNAQWFMKAARTVGWDFIYTREAQANEVNYTGDVVQMRNLGVETVLFLGDVGNLARFWRTMYDQQFFPKLKYVIATAYDSGFFTLVGEPKAAEGTVISLNVGMYLGGDTDEVPELARFREWMGRVDPNQVIDLFAFYGWTSMKLFAEAARTAGPELTRAKLFATLDGTHRYDGDGIQVPVDVGNKQSLGPCEVYLEVRDGAFHRQHPATGFTCAGTFVPGDA